MKNFKNIQAKLALLIIIILALHISSVAEAATLSLSPSNITVHKGEKFSISVGVSGALDASTVQMNAIFTPNILKFSSWHADDSWMVLKTSDADSFSNTTGSLLKTSGFPGGFSGYKNFGSATFVATNEGTGTISLSPNSFIYNSLNDNTYTPGNTVSVTVLPESVKEPVKDSTHANIKQPVQEIKQETASAEVDRTFDIAVELPKANFNVGEDLTTTVHLTNLSSKLEDLQVPITYQIFDVDGRMVKSSNGFTNIKGLNIKFQYNLNTSDLLPGIYNLRGEVAIDNLTTPAVSQVGFNIGSTAPIAGDNKVAVAILLSLVTVAILFLASKLNFKKLLKK